MSVDPLSYFNSKKQADAVETAANIGATSTDKALALQEKIYKESQANQLPWQEAGKAALGQLTAGTAAGGEFTTPFTLANYQEDPGYQFRLSEGIKALDRSASAKGQLLSGSALKGLTDYGQGMASQEYQNAYNRYMTERTQRYNQLASLAGVGQTANAALGQAGQAFASGSGNLLAGNAANQANAQMAIANINSSMYQGLANSGAGAMNALGQWAGSRSGGGGYQPNYGGGGYSSVTGSGGGYTDSTAGRVPVA